MAVADTTKPVLTSLSFPTSVDVTGGGTLLTFTAGASDDGHGVEAVSVSFDKVWQSDYGWVSSFAAYDWSDSYSDGLSSSQYYVDDTSAAGIYTINSVIVYDKAGNYTYYYASDIAAMGIATSFEIKNDETADTTKPVLTSLSFPTIVDVTGGGTLLTFTAGASDAGLGVHYVSVSFDKSWQSDYGRMSYFDASNSIDSYADGLSSSQYYMDDASAAGIYTINNVIVYDKAGNYTNYYASDIAAMGIATSFEIKSNQVADTTKPVLTSLSLPKSMDVTGGGTSLTFTAGASDAGIGVDYVYVSFDRNWQSEYGRTSSFTAHDSIDSYADGLSSSLYYMDDASAAGTYTINHVIVYDKAGNYTYYYASDIAAMGIQTSFQIIDRNAGVTADVTASGSVMEGSGGLLAPVLTLHDVGSYSGMVTIAFDAEHSTVTADEVSMPAFVGYYDVVQSPIGDYVINLPEVAVGVVDDLLIEGDEILAFKIIASGQTFASGTDSEIVTVTVADNDRAGTTGHDIMDGDAGNNYLAGLAGDDSLNGHDGNDRLAGGDGHDRLDGGAGDDLLEPGAGNNIVDGGEGFDTLVLSGARTSYSLISADGWTYVVGEEGASRIVNVEQVAFADATLATTDLAGSLSAFDGLRYVAGAPDLIVAIGLDAARGAEHYVASGFTEGRDALTFDPIGYLAGYDDLIVAFGTDTAAATQHYILSGFAEGRSGGQFDGLRYLASYVDLSMALGTDTEAAARHYVQSGHAEGRDPGLFDAYGYLAGYEDLIDALGSDTTAATQHYLTQGRFEGRSDDLFDGLQYLASYADLSAALGADADAAARHYVQSGHDEGRAADIFDGLRYIASNPDLIVALGSDDDAAALHYIVAGRGEGRDVDGFDALAYAAANPDLAAAFGTDAEALTEHYIDTGYYEHRILTPGADMLVVG